MTGKSYLTLLCVTSGEPITWTRETRLPARGGTPVKGDEGLSPLRAIGRRDGRRGIGWRRVALRDDPGRLPSSGSARCSGCADEAGSRRRA
jgi:hypothetical protein